MERESLERTKGASRATQGAGVALVGLAAAGCQMVQERLESVTGSVKPVFAPYPQTPEGSLARHALNRVAFGAKPGEVAQVAAKGTRNYIEEQLADRLTEDPIVEWRVNALDLHTTVESAPDTLNSMPDNQLLGEMLQMSLLRATYSRHQLREVLADFWTNHFNIYALKNDERTLVPVDNERVVRPYVLGKFRDMLLKSAHSPAMLSYLDNQLNKKGVANENYAREILELHTLGVNSGYTQKDIQEVARCFTGWKVRKGEDFALTLSRIREGLRNDYEGFVYDPKLHDEGAKFVPFLNLRLAPNGGKQDADRVLEALAVHPATARFLARKLCRRFLGHTPEATIEKAAQAYLKHDTDIRQMLRPILLDALPDIPACRPIFKRPLECMVSVIRALGADTDGDESLQTHLTAMGQPLHQWPMPDGFPEKASSWTGSLLPRWNFALALTAQNIRGTTVDLNAPLKIAQSQTEEGFVNAILEGVLNLPTNTAEAQSLRVKLQRHRAEARQTKTPEPQILAETVALALSAPAFQWR